MLRMEMISLNNDVEYARAVERLEEIFEGPMSTKEKEEFNNLSLLIEEYESAHFSLINDDSV